ncbi:CRISPR-associated protein Cas2 [Nannocystis exedens]|uniref:CRISPR-associated endoribonuclease Cas2 n=1 Tax=Nannocystis exedens TaxID=54 RepID=A0A1I2J7A5_9BACT|nr:CRISPR-associated endonuclease Cas2 [Nannocystis exedens]PCC74657.1 CRISPR-associated endonuclease Cas2 [Nannocystis exedens]SFF48581.1 CRISPR-associated protein Cas2 [Nannocystis exedens]
MRSHYIVSYDIADPSRLRRVHRTLRDFGDGIQLSVFACQLTDRDRAVLECRLLEILNQREDQVLFIKLGQVAEDGDAPPRCSVLGRRLTPGFVRALVY